MSGIGRFLDWDSAFFGIRMGAIARPSLSPETLSEAEAWSAAQNLECLSFLAEAEDAVSIRLAEEHGFRLVDIRLLLEHPLLPGAAETGPAASAGAALTGLVRPFRGEDLPALKAAARENHPHTRFFRDSRFPRAKAAELYAVWLEKTCADPEAAVFTAEIAGKPAGYISCRDEGQAGSRIVLAGVGRDFRGLGVGTRLVRTALAWCEGHGARPCSVVTQGANLPAQRLYTSNGFYPRRVQLWYHKWTAGPRGFGEG